MAAEQNAVRAFDVPLTVELIDGEVAIVGPDRLCGSFTKAAALESGRRLIAAAGEAEPTYQKPLG